LLAQKEAACEECEYCFHRHRSIHCFPSRIGVLAESDLHCKQKMQKNANFSRAHRHLTLSPDFPATPNAFGAANSDQASAATASLQ
jgi:hypothetical protein